MSALDELSDDALDRCVEKKKGDSNAETTCGESSHPPLTPRPTLTYTHSAFDAAIASHMAAARGEPVREAPTAAAARAAVTGVALGGDRRGYVHHSAAVRDAVVAAGRSVGVETQQPADDDGGAQRRNLAPPAGLPPQPPPPPAPPAWLYADADAFR
jgi:hypothetical protein